MLLKDWHKARIWAWRVMNAVFAVTILTAMLSAVWHHDFSLLFIVMVAVSVWTWVTLDIIFHSPSED